MKKYTNDNIFLNSINDITREAYTQQKSNVFLPAKTITERFDTDILLNKKEEFETSNDRINNLNEEIQELKNKLKLVYEKDQEIYEKKCKIETMENEILSLQKEITQLSALKIKNRELRDECDRLQVLTMNHQTMEKENALLKRKIIELHNESDQESQEAHEISQESQEAQDTDQEISINVEQLKVVLYNRLKSYHEKHIDNLIQNYELETKSSLDKETMEKLLIEAIHL